MVPRQAIPDGLDQSRLSDEDRRRAHIAAVRLHRISGVARAVYRYIDRLAAMHDGPLRVLVVPCPDIEIPICWARRAQLSGFEIDLVLANVDPVDSVRTGIAQTSGRGITIDCIDFDYRRASIPAGFDLIISMHCMHQLRDDQVIRHLQSMIVATAGPLVVCDYARSSPNAWLAKLASQVISRHALARQSVANQILAAYSVDEFQRLAEDALARPVKVERLFPCHFILACEEKAIPQAVPAFA